MNLSSTTLPYSPKTILLVGGAIAVVSLIFSIGMFWLQINQGHNAEHITGAVVSVEATAIVIQNARGATTTLLISPTTKIGDISPLSSLKIGTKVMAVGQRQEDGTYLAEGIRALDSRKK